MTDKRMTNEPGASRDPLVSEAYRETATERAPEHLNAAVLKTAAEAARPQYSLLRTWTRPVAWAAVVVLSFGLVLELTQAPEPPLEEQMIEAPATVAEPEPAGLAKRERDKADAQELKVQNTDMLERAEEMARMQQGPNDTPAPQAAVPLSEKRAMRSAATLVEMETGCDEAARAEPGTWLACIDELEKAGLSEVARAERELFDAAFPDLENP